VDQVIVTANKIDIVAYLTAIFDLIKLALVGNQAQSKLGEAERKAENLKNQAQVSQNHCVGVQKVKSFKKRVITTIMVEEDTIIWSSFLCACRKS